MIAIPEYYHGKGVWEPHLSLIKLNNIQKSNITLYNLYQENGTIALINKLRGVKGTIDNLNMSIHFNSLRFSVITI